MIKTVDSEPPKTVTELTHILRWEDDGGAVFETCNLLPHVAETDTTIQSMDMPGECLSNWKHDQQENLNE